MTKKKPQRREKGLAICPKCNQSVGIGHCVMGCPPQASAPSKPLPRQKEANRGKTGNIVVKTTTNSQKNSSKSNIVIQPLPCVCGRIKEAMLHKPHIKKTELVGEWRHSFKHDKPHSYHPAIPLSDLWAILEERISELYSASKREDECGNHDVAQTYRVAYRELEHLQRKLRALEGKK